MKILTVQLSSPEHIVTVSGYEWTELVRKGPNNWWRWMGSSLEPVPPWDEENLERLFKYVKLEDPPTCQWNKIDGQRGYRIWTGSCGRNGIRPAHEEYPTEEDKYCPSCGKLISVGEDVLRHIRRKNEKENHS